MCLVRCDRSEKLAVTPPPVLFNSFIGINWNTSATATRTNKVTEQHASLALNDNSGIHVTWFEYLVTRVVNEGAKSYSFIGKILALNVLFVFLLLLAPSNNTGKYNVGNLFLVSESYGLMKGTHAQRFGLSRHLACLPQCTPKAPHHHSCRLFAILHCLCSAGVEN